MASPRGKASSPDLRTFFLPGAAGRIECLHRGVPESVVPRAAAVVCHPHPLFGGTMHNKVVHATATTILGAGIPVLRFNFRGAGLSAGAHDSGNGEREDFRVVLDFVAERYAGLPLPVAGYSFGAYVCLPVASTDDRVATLIGIGVPVGLYEFSFLQQCTKPVTFIQGERDQFGPLPLVMVLAASTPGGGKVMAVPGATHGFTDKLDELSRRVGEAIPPELTAY